MLNNWIFFYFSEKYIVGHEKKPNWIGRYGGRGSASSSVGTMYLLCKQNPKDPAIAEKGKYLQFNLLENDICYHHKPGDTTLIALLHPSGFIVLPYNLVIK